MPNNSVEISIILPCLNEEAALSRCLTQIEQVIQENSLQAEIILVDNGSTDQSTVIAGQYNVNLIHEPEKGYGAACRKGFESAQGRYLLLADADGSYDFNEIPRFISELKNGYDFVIGNRFQGKIYSKAMPWMHQYIGNPVLSSLLRLFFKAKVQDVHCGIRAISKQAFEKLSLRTTGMEFASEMVIQSIKRNLKIKELPVDYHCRLGHSKLKSLADGWRHLRFMLLYSPLFLFFFPGLLILLTGTVALTLLYFDRFTLGGIRFQFHPMFVSALFIVIGYQLIIFALFAKTYAITHLGDRSVLEKLYKYLTIEKVCSIAILFLAVGAFIYCRILFQWMHSGGGELNEIKNSILALILIVVGVQTTFSAFMLSILGIKEQ